MHNGIGALLIILLIISIGYIGFNPSKTITQTITLTGNNVTTITTYNSTISTVTVNQTSRNFNITVSFTLYQADNVQYVLYANNNNVGTGILNENTTIPIPLTQSGNVTVSTLIVSNNQNSNVKVEIFQNDNPIASGFNGINQKNFVIGFVN